jgi:hypothetical protein
MNYPKKKCVSADLMRLFLVRFVTVRLTYIFIDSRICQQTSFLAMAIPNMGIEGVELRKTDKSQKSYITIMRLFLVRFVTVRLTYIFIDYPDCEYIIILNTSIVIYDFWLLSVLRSSTPSMPIFGNRHRQKACLLTNTRITTPFFQYTCASGDCHY